jgi:hypothetical protein
VLTIYLIMFELVVLRDLIGYVRLTVRGGEEGSAHVAS